MYMPRTLSFSQYLVPLSFAMVDTSNAASGRHTHPPVALRQVQDKLSGMNVADSQGAATLKSHHKVRLARLRPCSAARFCEGKCMLEHVSVPAPLYLTWNAVSECITSGAGVRVSPSVRTATPPPRNQHVPWSTPKSWASLASSKPARGSALVDHGSPSVTVAVPVSNSTPATPNRAWATRRPRSMQELYSTAHECTRAPLLAPRGLVNLGNFCFANAILQVLAHTPAFYMFMTQLSTMVPQDLSNTTPLLEAMIRFLGEFREEESPGAEYDPFVPDYVYEAMRLHRRFDVMQIGHQEDAEEFFSLVLNTLHEEVQMVMQRTVARQELLSRRLGRVHGRHASESNVTDAQPLDDDAQHVVRPASPDDDDTWLEVGQKGRTSLARSAKTSESPMTRMFDGRLRSNLNVPGSKSSIMLEPYRSLPLDIAADHISTVEDALRQLSVPETISDVWAPAHGTHADATKQVSLEMLPPVLVLHLKRFVFDEVGGVQKSCKPIHFGPTLHIPPEVLSAPLRRADPNPTYRLYGAVYHHGSLTSGGHYTVDILRQDGSGWLYIDDTNVSPIPADQVFGSVEAREDVYLLFYQKIKHT